MFNDERINLISGKIYRRGIIVGTIISFIYLIIKSLSMITNGSFSIFCLISELFITIGGFITICIGESRMSGNEKDERYYYDKYSYYIKAAKDYFYIILLGFAIAVPFEFLITSNRLPLNMLLIYLQILGLIYFCFYFKKNNIFFNYTFISEDKNNYYKKAFKNIGKIIFLIFIIYFISFVLSLILFIGSNILLSVMLAIVFVFLFSSLSFSLIYLYISWLERISYIEENEDRKYSKTNLILGTTMLILYLLYTIISINNILFISKVSNNHSVLVGEKLTNYNNIITYLKYYYLGLFGMLMTNLLLKLKGYGKSLLGVNLVIVAIICKITFIFINKILNSFNFNIEVIRILYLITWYLIFLITIIRLFGLLFLFIGLIRELKMKKVIIILPVFAILLAVVSIFLQTNDSLEKWAYFNYLSEYVISVFVVIVFVFINKNNKPIFKEDL